MTGVQIDPPPRPKKILSQSPALLGLNSNIIVYSEGIAILQKCFFSFLRDSRSCCERLTAIQAIK